MNKSINKLQAKRLKENNLAIEEHYVKRQGAHIKEYVKSSDIELEYNIINCSRKDKRFFKENKCIYVEDNYDKGILYSYIAPSKSNEQMTCPNCGHSSNSEMFLDGCPYCGTYFNMIYNKSQTNSSPFDVIFSGKYFKNFSKIYIIFYILITIFRIFYTLNYNNEPEKILNLVYSTIFGFVVLYFVVYILISIILLITLPFMLTSLEKYNNIDKFWEILQRQGVNINKIRFINELNDEICSYYYDDKLPNHKELIDFDIIHYNKIDYYKDDSNEFILVEFKMRKFFYKNNRIKKRTDKIKLIMIRNKNYVDNKNDYQVIGCPSCGASINLREPKCSYCNADIDFNSEWNIHRFISY